MKRFYSLSLLLLALTIVFFGCNSGSSANTGSTDSSGESPATVANTNNANQQNLEANKKLVTEFYQALYGDKDSTALDKYVADDIKQHSPLLQDGKEWLRNTLRPFLTSTQSKKVKMDIKQIAAEGDRVWLFVKDVAPNGKEFARVDIFRVENGKIAENWKTSEPVAAKSANNNGAF